MDKRYKPLTPMEELQIRRNLLEELIAKPIFPIPAVTRKIGTGFRFTTPEYAKLCDVSARDLQDIDRGESSPTLITAEKLLHPIGMTLGAVKKMKPSRKNWRS